MFNLTPVPEWVISIPVPEPEPLATIAPLFPLGEKVVVFVVVAPLFVTVCNVSTSDCKALSAKSREAFTLASSFVSSILPATIEAVKALAVIVKSISEVSVTVSIVFTSAPVSIPSSLLPSVAMSLPSTVPETAIFTVDSVFVAVSKVKSTSPSNVPSPVQTPTWLFTGVPTFETSPEPAGVANVGAEVAPLDLRNVPSAPSANSVTSPKASE